MKYQFGVDLGATNIAVGLVDEKYNIVAKTSVPTRAPRSAQEICDDIAAGCRSVAQRAGVSLDQVVMAGLALPGMSDHTTGELIYANNLKLYHTPIRQMMEERLAIPCYAENDANAAAFGEFLAGGAKGYRNVLMVTLGSGVGGGILLDGKIYTGAFFAGAEIGHMPMVFGGRPCNCGRHGCIETYCSANGLILTTKEAMRDNPTSIMWELCEHNMDKVDGQTAFLAKDRGDPVATQVVDLYIRQLADALSGYINFIEPELLLLGGGVSKQGDSLLIPLRRQVADLVYDRYAPKQTLIETAALENDAGIIGAAFLSQAAYI